VFEKNPQHNECPNNVQPLVPVPPENGNPQPEAIFYAGNSGGPGNGTIIGSWDVTAVAPVPEPATLALAGLGALGCVLMFCRRKS
jgi:hypothetical protein